MLMVDDFYVGPAKLNPSSIKARLPKTRRVRKAAEVMPLKVIRFI